MTSPRTPEPSAADGPEGSRLARITARLPACDAFPIGRPADWFKALHKTHRTRFTAVLQGVGARTDHSPLRVEEIYEGFFYAQARRFLEAMEHGPAYMTASPVAAVIIWHQVRLEGNRSPGRRADHYYAATAEALGPGLSAAEVAQAVPIAEGYMLALTFQARNAAPADKAEDPAHRADWAWLNRVKERVEAFDLAERPCAPTIH